MSIPCCFCYTTNIFIIIVLQSSHERTPRPIRPNFHTRHCTIQYRFTCRNSHGGNAGYPILDFTNVGFNFFGNVIDAYLLGIGNAVVDVGGVDRSVDADVRLCYTNNILLMFVVVIVDTLNYIAINATEGRPFIINLLLPKLWLLRRLIMMMMLLLRRLNL